MYQRKASYSVPGPSLPVAGVLADPTVKLFSGSTSIASNDDWQNSPQAAEIAASGLAPSNSLEPALLMNLTEIAVSSGAACSSADPEPSHVLRAMGVTEELTRASLRFGLGRFNSERQRLAERYGIRF